jgi:hypothetical protein
MGFDLRPNQLNDILVGQLLKVDYFFFFPSSLPLS